MFNSKLLHLEGLQEEHTVTCVLLTVFVMDRERKVLWVFLKVFPPVVFYIMQSVNCALSLKPCTVSPG